MVSGRHKSRTLRRVPRKGPGNTVRTHYKKRRPGAAHCASCKTVLKGTLRLRNNKARNTAASKKRPERKYGGKLCSKCSREKLIEEARK